MPEYMFTTVWIFRGIHKTQKKTHTDPFKLKFWEIIMCSFFDSYVKKMMSQTNKGNSLNISSNVKYLWGWKYLFDALQKALL